MSVADASPLARKRCPDMSIQYKIYKSEERPLESVSIGLYRAEILIDTTGAIQSSACMLKPIPNHGECRGDAMNRMIA